GLRLQALLPCFERAFAVGDCAVALLDLALELGAAVADLALGLRDRSLLRLQCLRARGQHVAFARELAFRVACGALAPSGGLVALANRMLAARQARFGLLLPRVERRLLALQPALALRDRRELARHLGRRFCALLLDF